MAFMCGINIFPFSSELKCSPRIFERDMAREVSLPQGRNDFCYQEGSEVHQ